ncbi:hypothetical protein QJS04_geneDACA019758 [Acorus gramineus]|uniref:RNase H type-1 domain-containing protein n=1 Tax=Acorus gramineus TaxID=55184 RepID=A0AAV9BW15_ACOGR|nr:hypothetical protein QJS04_geneDACA019758 [Acorus gramineus]
MDQRIRGAGYTGWPWASPLKAEMEAVRMGAETAWAMGYKNMLIGTDSEGVVRLLQSDSLGPPQVQNILERVKRVKNNGVSIQAV